jgi:hypothetical protein
MLDYISNLTFTLLPISLLFYFLLRVLLFRCISGWSDPLNISLIFAAFSIAGFAALPIAHHVGNTFWIISFLMFLYFLSASILKLPKILPDKVLRINKDIQLKFSLILMLIVLTALLNDISSGNIAILREGGNSTRFLGASESNRLLIWLNYSISGMPIIFYSLSEHKAVKKISLATIFMILFKSVLFASKGALFSVPLTLTMYHYLIGIKAQVCGNDGNLGYVDQKISEALKFRSKLGITILALFSILGILFPFFAILIQGANNYAEGFNLIFSRLFAGFDNLIYVSISNIPMENIMSKYGFNSILVLYFLSFLKVFFGFKPEFNSASEIIVHEVFGVDSSLLRQVPLPNSNLILELAWTSGFEIGAVLIFLFGLSLFSLRKYFLLKNNLKLIDIIFFNSIVMNPLLWFTSGIEFVNYLITNLLLYISFALAINLRQGNFLKSLKFKLI